MKHRPTRWIQLALALLVWGLGALYVSGQLRLPLVSRLDLWLYDLRIQATATAPQQSQVVILDIDEASLARLGQWPWPRPQLAQLVDTLFEQYRIRALGFDVVFAEAEHNPATTVLQRLHALDAQAFQAVAPAAERLQQEFDGDRQFATSLRQRPIVLGCYFYGDLDHQTGTLPAPWLPALLGDELGLRTLRARGVGANLATLQQAAASGGHFTPALDEDGIVRSVPLLIRYQDGLYPALSLALLSQIEAGAPLDFGPEVRYLGETSIESFLLGRHRLPVDRQGKVLVPYYGPPGTLPYLSAAAVLAGETPLAALQDKIVILGTSAPGLMDLRATPIHPAFPGVEIHANLLHAMLEGQLPQQPRYTLGLELLSLSAIALLLWLAAGSRSPLWLGLSSFALLGTVIGLSTWLWLSQRLVIPLAASLLSILALLAGYLLSGYLLEYRSKRQINRLFGQYVPPELVETMNQDPSRYTMDGRAEEMTVLFADVRGFTTLSEQLDPKALATLMNRLLTELSQVIRAQYLGTIDKYIGDCIMAFWGAPVARADHACAAVAAALDMHTALARLQSSLVLPAGVTLAIGTGINSGRMVVGNMGSAYRMAYTVMGDAVNTASRLEGLSKTYGARIVIGEATWQQVRDSYLCRELDRVRVKGRETPLQIYEPLARLADADALLRQSCEQHQTALDAYRARQWAEAAAIWQALQQQAPSALYTLYLQRVQHWREHAPPADWDGVFTFDSK